MNPIKKDSLTGTVLFVGELKDQLITGLWGGDNDTTKKKKNHKEVFVILNS